VIWPIRKNSKAAIRPGLDTSVWGLLGVFWNNFQSWNVFKLHKNRRIMI